MVRIIHEPTPPVDQAIKLKVLLRSVLEQPRVVSSPSVQPIVKEVHKEQPIKPKPIQSTLPAPKTPNDIKPPIIQPGPPLQAPIASQPVPVASTVPKTAESSDATTKKTVPIPSAPLAKVEENYEDNHLGEIRSILAQRLKYPKNARRLNQQGEVSVTFTLSQHAEVSQIVISKSSSFDLLDDAARDLIVSSSSEFPKPAKTVRITVPISYILR